MVMDFMLSMGSGLGLSPRVEDQHQACTSFALFSITKNLIVAIRIYHAYRKTKMDVKEGNTWDRIYRYAK